MTTFGWKRKIGEQVSKTVSPAFSAAANDEEETGEVDWLHQVPKRQAIHLEDGVTKAKRLREEGSILAGKERYWEALQKWEDALIYNPSDEAIHEMRAQAYMQVGEVLPAIQAAKKSVFVNPCWWVSHQTLGRAYLGVGEVKKALRSFCKAVHLNPSCEELWEDDLRWTLSLCMRSDSARDAQALLKEEAKVARVVELDEDGFCKEVVATAQTNTAATSAAGNTTHNVVDRPTNSIHRKPPRQGTTLPHNYVCLRD